MTLSGLLSATDTFGEKLKAFVGALWKSKDSHIAASLSALNQDNRFRILRGVAVLALGYLIAMLSQVWLMCQ